MKTPEEEALSLGWRPKEEWKGPEEAWKPAEKFLEDGERMAGFVRKRLEKDFETRLAGIERAANSALEAVQKQAEQERTELLAQLNEKKKAAIADNDLETLETVREQIAEVRETKPQGPDPQALKAAEEFKAKHSFWQGKDWVVQNFADGAAGKLQARGLSPQEFFAELDTQIREAFPDRFGKAKKRNGAVEGDSPPSESNDGKSYSDLPKEAKAACDDYVKRIKGYTREQYVKEYFGA